MKDHARPEFKPLREREALCIEDLRRRRPIIDSADFSEL